MSPTFLRQREKGCNANKKVLKEHLPRAAPVLVSFPGPPLRYLINAHLKAISIVSSPVT